MRRSIWKLSEIRWGILWINETSWQMSALGNSLYADLLDAHKFMRYMLIKFVCI